MGRRSTSEHEALAALLAAAIEAASDIDEGEVEMFLELALETLQPLDLASPVEQREQLLADEV